MPLHVLQGGYHCGHNCCCQNADASSGGVSDEEHCQNVGELAARDFDVVQENASAWSHHVDTYG
jgi:hypothetical protein